MLSQESKLQDWQMKRLLDLFVSLIVLVLILPLFALIAAGIRMSMGAPVFFCQTRPGLKGEPFSLLKFRSMVTAFDDRGKMLPGQKRLTPLGRFLRNLSLDELPQLVNVLKGDMSLVGPRPLLMEYLDLYTPEQKRRLDVRPGITGWAQVNGRNALTWEERFALDVWYVDHQSIRLDLKILWMTLVKVVRREGVTTRDGNLAAHFAGTRPRKEKDSSVAESRSVEEKRDNSNQGRMSSNDRFQ
jgi:lipopolysaccharide/colanic/teichoic acid biosynthesis glycosyltransferase